MIRVTSNSIGHPLEGMRGSDTCWLTNFYDETLGHYLWHVGFAGLLALFAPWEAYWGGLPEFSEVGSI